MPIENSTDPNADKRLHDHVASAMESHVTREKYIAANMVDVPKGYHQLMPFSTNLVDLTDAEQRVREQFESDKKAYNARAQMSSQQLIELGLKGLKPATPTLPRV
jgi:hypothetical protein